MTLTNSSISCGVKQLHNLDGLPSSILRESFNYLRSVDDWTYDHLGMVIFSDTTAKRVYGGPALAKYIVANGLGDIVESKIIRNPNSGNRIRTWIWHVNRRALRKWSKANA